MKSDKERKQYAIVKGLVVDEENRILFVRRKREWHKESHNKWELPGGKVEFKENPELSVKREVKEETGYDIEVGLLLPKVVSSAWDYGDRETHQILLCYVCRKVGGNQVLGDCGVSEIKWFDIDSLPGEMDCLPGTVDFLETYFNRFRDI